MRNWGWGDKALGDNMVQLYIFVTNEHKKLYILDRSR